MTSSMINTNIEEWRDVEGYEGYYQVSNFGNVRSLDRRMHNYTKKGRILKIHNNGHGYFNVALSGNEYQKHAYVHILVATAFIPKIDGCYQVNHKDFNKANNHVSNLEWVTPKENRLHYRKSKRCTVDSQQRIARANKKYVDNVLKVKDNVIKLYSEGSTIKEIVSVVGISKEMVSDILKLYELL